MRDNHQTKVDALTAYMRFTAEVDAAVDVCLNSIERAKGNLESGLDALRGPMPSPAREKTVDRAVAAMMKVPAPNEPFPG